MALSSFSDFFSGTELDPGQALVLADAVLAVHVAFAAFVVLGLAAVWLGAYLKWKWVHNLMFRLIHLGAMAFVACESWLGVFCPLTEWEHRLRVLAGGPGKYGSTFMRFYAEKIFYFDLPEAVFTVVYTVFLGLVAASLYFVPIRRRRVK